MTRTRKVAEPKSTAPPVLFANTAVAVFAAVTATLKTKSATSRDKEAKAKSPKAAPGTVTSTATSSPSAMLAASQVAETTGNPDNLDIRLTLLNKGGGFTLPVGY